MTSEQHREALAAKGVVTTPDAADAEVSSHEYMAWFEKYGAARRRYLATAQAYAQALDAEGVYTNSDAASPPVQQLRADAEAATRDYIAMVEAQGHKWEDLCPEPEPPCEPEPEDAMELELG
jgi:hypothetical protein